jgi:hypothetical protein
MEGWPSLAYGVRLESESGFVAHRGFKSYTLCMTQLELFETPVDMAGVFSVSLDKTPGSLPGEVWMVHPSGLPVSNLGRVYGARGNIIGSTKMRTSKAAHGVRPDYVRVNTSVNGVKVNAYVHVLVLEAWVGPRPADHDADHIDTDIFNNHVDNLRWRPAAENRATK